MSYVIYRKASTAIVEVTRYRPYKVTSSYKTMAAAKAALTRMSKAAQADLSKYNIDNDPQFIYAIAEREHYCKRIERQVTRTGIAPGSGKEITLTMSVNEVGGCTDPFTERYWSM